MRDLSRASRTIRWAVTFVCAGLLAAQPAAADIQLHRDARNDVTRELGSPPRGGRAGIDVLALRNSYVDGRLRVSMRTVHLREDGWGAYWTIKTGPDTGYALYYENSLDRPYVVFFPENLGAPRSRPPGARPPKTCKSAKAIVRDSVVSASVPSRCIGDAKVVKVAGHMQDNDRNYLVDDSREKGLKLDSSPFTFGPPLRRS